LLCFVQFEIASLFLFELVAVLLQANSVVFHFLLEFDFFIFPYLILQFHLSLGPSLFLLLRVNLAVLEVYIICDDFLDNFEVRVADFVRILNESSRIRYALPAFDPLVQAKIRQDGGRRSRDA